MLDKLKHIALLMPLLPTFSGCIYLATLQEPKVLETGEVRGGAGFFYVDSHGPIGEGSIRVGLGRNFDAGAKFGLNAVRVTYSRGFTTYVDLRYQFLSEPIFMTSGIGTSTFLLDPPRGDEIVVRSVQPFLLAGQENWYVGIRPYYLFGTGSSPKISDALVFREYSWSPIALTLGGSIRVWEDGRILFEINHLIFSGGKSVQIPALGIQKSL